MRTSARSAPSPRSPSWPAARRRRATTPPRAKTPPSPSARCTSRRTSATPQGGGQGVTEALTGNVYEGLYRLTDDGEVEPLLAEDAQVSRRRPDVHDHAARRRDLPLRRPAHLGRREVEHRGRHRRGLAVSARKSSFTTIADIATPDDQTVVFTLSQRSISFLYNLSYVWIVNDEAGDITSTEDGTGPYTLDEWKQRLDPDASTRWDDYWGEPAKNGEVVFTLLHRRDRREQRPAHGRDRRHHQRAEPRLAHASSTDNDDYVVSEGTSTTKELLAFNDRVAPFDNALVRKAIYSADRHQEAPRVDLGRLRHAHRLDGPADRPLVRGPHAGEPVRRRAREGAARRGRLRRRLHVHARHPELRPAPGRRASSCSRSSPRSASRSRSTRSAPTSGTRRCSRSSDFQATLQEHVNDRDVVWYGNPDFYWGYDNADVQQWVAEAEQAADDRRADGAAEAGERADRRRMRRASGCTCTRRSSSPRSDLTGTRSTA